VAVVEVEAEEEDAADREFEDEVEDQDKVDAKVKCTVVAVVFDSEVVVTAEEAVEDDREDSVDVDVLWLDEVPPNDELDARDDSVALLLPVGVRER